VKVPRLGQPFGKEAALRLKKLSWDREMTIHIID
jgi:hypothetical protein